MVAMTDSHGIEDPEVKFFMRATGIEAFEMIVWSDGQHVNIKPYFFLFF